MGRLNNIAGEFPLLESLLKDCYAVNHMIADSPLGAVYSGASLSNGKPVAIKVINLDLLNRVGRLASARWARLNHPHVVSILAMKDFPDHGIHCCIMELLKAEVLDRFLDTRSDLITVRGLLDILEGAARGLDALHGARILHLDIKPTSIMVNASMDCVKIVDHGISLAREMACSQAAESILGTPEYMAPERVIGANYGPSADIYSFAAMLYTIFARVHLFEYPTRREVAYAQVNDMPRPLRSHNPLIPAYSADAIHRSLNKDPHLRHSTASEMMCDVATGFARHEISPLEKFILPGGQSDRESRVKTA